MPTSANILGEKLRAARAAAGMSTRVAAREAARLGVPISHTTIANYERGDSLPTANTIKLLAAIYGCPVEHLLGETPTLSGVRYRALKSVLVRERRRFEGEATRWTFLYFELECVLDKPLQDRGFRASAGESGAELAWRVREKTGLGDRPIPSVIRLLETFGIRVIQIDSAARIDGMAAVFGHSPVVALNPHVPPDRFRFNAGHELAHHLFEDWREPAPCPHDGDDRAHEFASHLLMPDSVLEHAFKGFSMVRLVRYKELFGLSLAAMIYRGRQRGLLTTAQYERVWREFGRLGWRTREPGYVAPDYSSRLEQLIEQAITIKNMSYTDVARLAAVDEGVVQSRVLEAIGGHAKRDTEPPMSIPLRGRP